MNSTQDVGVHVISDVQRDRERDPGKDVDFKFLRKYDHFENFLVILKNCNWH